MSEEQEVVIPGPGEILKKAREAENLSTEDIATKVRLKKALIEDLEQDNYDINISLTFIKGYLKLYAKQVKVPEDVIVEAFEKHNSQKKEPAKLQSFSRRFSHQTNDDKWMFVTYLIVAAVIALVVVWWLQQSDGDSKVSSFLSTTAKAVETTISPEPELEVEADIPAKIESSTPVVEAVSIQYDNVTSEVPLTQESLVVDPASTLEEAETVINDQNSDVETAVEQASDELQDTIDDEPAQAESAETAATPVPTGPPVELVFEFFDNCWMNLTDATGEDIAYGVKVKGRVMPITGIPPFVVTLGAPEMVKITYDGEPVDMSFIAPGRSAKFDLPLTASL